MNEWIEWMSEWGANQGPQCKLMGGGGGRGGVWRGPKASWNSCVWRAESLNLAAGQIQPSGRLMFRCCRWRAEGRGRGGSFGCCCCWCCCSAASTVSGMIWSVSPSSSSWCFEACVIVVPSKFAPQFCPGVPFFFALSLPPPNWRKFTVFEFFSRQVSKKITRFLL